VGSELLYAAILAIAGIFRYVYPFGSALGQLQVDIINIVREFANSR